MKSKRKIFRKSIFFKLIVSFILFAIAIVTTFAICLVLEALVISGGDPKGWDPTAVIDENGNVTDAEIIENLGGWIEELDEDCNILKVYGDKKTPQQSYTMDELLKLTSIYSDSGYAAFYVAPENSDRRFLCVYGKDVMQLNATLIINNIPPDNPNPFLLFFPLAIAEMILISLYHRRTIKRPLDRIILGMKSLRSGNYDTRIDIKTEAEFEEIVKTFNLMADRLETEKTEKERLTKNKNRMLLELSHDIRTPIATIKSFANALEAGLVPEERIQEYYRTIDVKANRVRALSEDMFTMLKMDDPNYTLNPERVNICEYLRRLCAEYYNEVSEGGFEFAVDIPEKEILYDIDVNLFSRVVGNLLTNAIKHNDTGSRISASFTVSDKLTFEIADDGQPIDSALAAEMFSPFSRGDKARKTDGGTGLGLAISKLIAEKHGGRISYFRIDNMNVFRVELDR